MAYYESGVLYEQCDRCDMRVEVDDREDGRGWGINHEYMFHGAGRDE